MNIVAATAEASHVSARPITCMPNLEHLRPTHARRCLARARTVMLVYFPCVAYAYGPPAPCHDKTSPAAAAAAAADRASPIACARRKTAAHNVLRCRPAMESISTADSGRRGKGKHPGICASTRCLTLDKSPVNPLLAMASAQCRSTKFRLMALASIGIQAPAGRHPDGCWPRTAQCASRRSLLKHPNTWL